MSHVRCLETNGQLCPHAIALLKSCNENVVDYVPYKYTVKGALDLLTKSLGALVNREFNVDFNTLERSTPQVIPPHVRVAAGRRPSKRLKKGERDISWLRRREEVADERGIIFSEELRVHRQFFVTCSICGEKSHNSMLDSNNNAVENYAQKKRLQINGACCVQNGTRTL